VRDLEALVPVLEVDRERVGDVSHWQGLKMRATRYLCPWVRSKTVSG